MSQMPMFKAQMTHPADAPSVEDLPEISAWGPKESVTDLSLGMGCLLNRFGNYSHLRHNTVTSFPTVLAIRTWPNTVLT